MPRRKPSTWKALDIENWETGSTSAVPTELIQQIVQDKFPCLPSKQGEVIIQLRNIVDRLFAELHSRERPTEKEKEVAAQLLFENASALKKGMQDLDDDTLRNICRAAKNTSDRPLTDFPNLPGLDIGRMKFREIQRRLDELITYLEIAKQRGKTKAGRRLLAEEDLAVSSLVEVWRDSQPYSRRTDPTRDELRDIVNALIKPVCQSFEQSRSLEGVVTKALYGQKSK